MIVESGLFAAVGERRGRYYVGSPELREVWTRIRNERPPRFDDDPYRLVALGDTLDQAAVSRRR
jgi:hypothetical protein